MKVGTKVEGEVGSLVGGEEVGASPGIISWQPDLSEFGLYPLAHLRHFPTPNSEYISRGQARHTSASALE